jgi:hypothetical protein
VERHGRLVGLLLVDRIAIFRNHGSAAAVCVNWEIIELQASDPGAFIERMGMSVEKSAAAPCARPPSETGAARVRGLSE